jgi:hypothetical protein
MGGPTLAKEWPGEMSFLAKGSSKVWCGALSRLVLPIVLDDKPQDSPEDLISDAERDAFVERLADRLREPENIAVKLIVVGYSHPEIVTTIAPLLAKKFGWGDMSWVVNAGVTLNALIESKNRVALISTLRDNFFSGRPISRKEMSALFAFIDPSFVSNVFRQVADSFKMQQGRPAKLNPSDYPRLAARADSLFPLTHKILNELAQGTKKTLLELLTFWRTDYPEAAPFLLSFCDQFERAVADQGLQKRRKTLPGRARLLADALAGAEFGLTLKTSIERVGEVRRSVRRSKRTQQ